MHEASLPTKLHLRGLLFRRKASCHPRSQTWINHPRSTELHELLQQLRSSLGGPRSLFQGNIQMKCSDLLQKEVLHQAAAIRSVSSHTPWLSEGRQNEICRLIQSDITFSHVPVISAPQEALRRVVVETLHQSDKRLSYHERQYITYSFYSLI